MYSLRRLTHRRVFSQFVQARNEHKYKDCDLKRDCLCKVQKKEKKRSFLGRLFSWLEPPKVKQKVKPPRECCRLLAKKKPKFEEIPEFIEKMTSSYENATLKRFGKGYIMEVPQKKQEALKAKTKEDTILEKIETPKQSIIEDICNPMPEFTTVAQRWIALQERNLHPLYKKYETTPRTLQTKYDHCRKYKFVPADIPYDKYPDKLKFGGPGGKTTFSNFKMPEVPRKLVGRMAEIKLNVSSELDVKRPNVATCRAAGEVKKEVKIEAKE